MLKKFLFAIAVGLAAVGRAPAAATATLTVQTDYDAASKVKSLYASAATDEKTGDLILKVVNANPELRNRNGNRSAEACDDRVPQSGAEAHAVQTLARSWMRPRQRGAFGLRPIYRRFPRARATRAKAKFVRANANPLGTEVDLADANNLTGQGTAIVLTSESPTDENTLENPTKVSPKTEPVSFTGTTLKRSFPGNSFTVLRLKTK